MSTNAAFGFALTPAYLKQVDFPIKARDQVHQMVNDVKTAFKTRIQELRT